ncbi:hypothetical protein TNCV_672431 [Trichonephila clavipes]|nr:hypothetical protein TNCV_672431 [Trichonephila clavipes]
MNQERFTLPSRMVKASQENNINHKNGYVFMNNLTKIDSTTFITFQTSGGMKRKHLEKTVHKYKKQMSIKTPTTDPYHRQCLLNFVNLGQAEV